MIESRIYGCPGTGKTTFLAAEAEKYAKLYHGDQINIVSLTNTSVREVFSRKIPIPNENISTLHKVCKRSLGVGDPAESHYKEFIEDNRSWSSTSGSIPCLPKEMSEEDDGYTGQSMSLFEHSQILRQQMVPRDRWPKEVLAFSDVWSGWCKDAGYMDFCGWLEACLDTGVLPPRQVVLVDEAQDHSKLQLAVLHSWKAKQLVLVGDDDQALFAWAGSTPDAFFKNNGHPVNEKVLSQSYRVPRAVHKLADNFVKRIRYRKNKVYKPRDFEGSVNHIDYTLKDPLFSDELPQGLLEDPDKTYMIIASCGYFLDPLINMLLEKRIPFWNPYRKEFRKWNPLREPFKCLDAFCSDDHLSGDNAAIWASHLKSEGVFKRRTKTSFIAMCEELGRSVLTAEEISAYFTGESATRVMMRDTSLIQESNKSKTWEYALDVYKKSPENPKLTIGSIHCSPYDEPILTTEGIVPIGELDPLKHRLASYEPKENLLHWGGRNASRGEPRKDMGYKFDISKRHYEGDLITIETQRSRTRVTPNHRIQVRFNEDFFHKWVVYLMRRGDWWRVGMCTSGYRPYKCGGISSRLATEQAEDVWILRVCETKKEAVYHEALIQGLYGISGLTFESWKDRTLSSKEMHDIHTEISQAASHRIDDLLRNFGLLRDAPLWTRQAKGIVKRSMRGQFLTEAANLLNGYMDVHVITDSFLHRDYPLDSKPDWFTAESLREGYSGDVYSLEVYPYHYYISGGMIVHNSIKGAEADNVYIFPNLSPSGSNQFFGDGADDVYRLFYVGITRAKENLFLCSQGRSRRAINWY